MNKFTKIFLRIMPIVLIAAIMVSSVYGINVTDPGAGNPNQDVKGLADRIWGTVVAVIQILAIAAIVIAGIRYMFASADAKADIKKQTIILVAGAALVFAAVPVAKFIAGVANGLIGGSTAS
jgi:Na+-transporting NADH:ubiquinone oxidoreductase subunit NqrC